MSRAVVENMMDSLSGPPHDELFGLIEWAFEHMPAQCPILQLLVNMFCDGWEDEFPHKDDTDGLKALPVSFITRAVKGYCQLARQTSRQVKEVTAAISNTRRTSSSHVSRYICTTTQTQTLNTSDSNEWFAGYRIRKKWTCINTTLVTCLTAGGLYGCIKVCKNFQETKEHSHKTSKIYGRER
jgi:hypothetical protein